MWLPRSAFRGDSPPPGTVQVAQHRAPVRLRALAARESAREPVWDAR